MDNVHGNLYRSIVITSQDKTTAVVRRALQKHNLEGASLHNYQLLQLLGDGQELLIPDTANAFYAMNPAGPCDFLLRHKEGAPNPSAFGTIQPSGKATLQSTSVLKDSSGTTALSATSYSTSSPSPPHLTPPSPAQVFPPSCAPHLRPPLHLLTPPIPAPSSWFLGGQQPTDLLCSPPTSPSSPHPLNLEPFSPILPHSLLPSPLPRAQTPAPVTQSIPRHPSGASSWTEPPSHCGVPHLSAPQSGEVSNSPEVLPHHNREVGPQGQSEFL